MRHFFSFPALSYLSCSRSALPTREPVCPSLSFSTASLSLYFLLLLCGCFLSTIYLLAITNWEARVGPPMTKLSLQVSPAPIFFAIAKTLHSVSKKERKKERKGNSYQTKNCIFCTYEGVFICIILWLSW